MPAKTDLIKARKNQFKAFGFSLVLHLGLILAGGVILFDPAQYGVQAGGGGLEVFLVAAPVRSRAWRDLPTEPLPPTAGELEAEDLVSPAPQTNLPQPDQGPSGDGSSKVPGSDPATLYAIAAAQGAGTPGLWANPAPPYPPAARRLGQEGRVLLKVAVGSSGLLKEVSVHQSSGFPLLDESALTTVRQWRFKPARVAGVPKDSVSYLPVNFVLKELDNEV